MHIRLLWMLAVCLLAACGHACADNRYVTVNGSAEVWAAPDGAVVSVGVHTTATDFTAAMSDADARVQRITAAAGALGIATDGIQTSDVTVSPLPAGDTRQIAGYAADSTVEISIRNPDQVQALVAGLVAAGATRLVGVRYTSRRANQYRALARRLALKATHDKASGMASAMHERLGRVISIVEQPAEASSEVSSGVVVPRSIAIRAAVRVSYELKPGGKELLRVIKSVVR